MLEALRVESTNASIAARLGISVETVRYHLENIRGKLGIEGRAELAPWREPEAPRRTRWSLAAPLALFRSGTFAARLGAIALTAALIAALMITTSRLRPVDEPASSVPATPSSVARFAWTYQGDAGYLNIAGQVALADGSVLVVGDVQNRGSDGRRLPLERDIALTKIRPDGRSVFKTTHASLGSDRVNGFALRPGGGVFVVDGTNGHPGGAKRLGRSDGYLAAFEATGRLEWVRTFGTPGIDAARAVSILEGGDVGVFWSAAHGSGRFSVFKPNGDMAPPPSSLRGCPLTVHYLSTRD